jgi:hypothetical protein
MRQAKPPPDLPSRRLPLPARLRRLLLPAFGWLLLAAAASAAEPAGIWRPDPAATAAMVDKLVAGMAQAVDPADKAEMRQQLPILRARLAELQAKDPDQAAELAAAIEQIEALVADDDSGFREQLRQSILDGLDMTLELKPGGELLLRDDSDPDAAEPGRWSLDSGQIELIGADEGAGMHMQGSFQGDRMELREVLPPEEEGDDENAALMREIVLVLIRQ